MVTAQSLPQLSVNVLFMLMLLHVHNAFNLQPQLFIYQAMELLVLQALSQIVSSGILKVLNVINVAQDIILVLIN
jgi:hypothetical protein